MPLSLLLTAIMSAVTRHQVLLDHAAHLTVLALGFFFCAA